MEVMILYYVFYLSFLFISCIQYYQLVLVHLSSSSDCWLVLGGGNVRYLRIDLMGIVRGNSLCRNGTRQLLLILSFLLYLEVEAGVGHVVELLLLSDGQLAAVVGHVGHLGLPAGAALLDLVARPDLEGEPVLPLPLGLSMAYPLHWDHLGLASLSL